MLAQSMPASITFVQAKDNKWICPDDGCDYTTDKIVNLREHGGRHHDFRITTVLTWYLTNEQKKSLKSNADRERKTKSQEDTASIV